jgi:HK97 family phage major capsid protein
MATKREQLEKLVHDMKAYGVELDAKTEAPSADELKKLNDMGAAVLVLVEEIKTSAKASGTLDIATSFLTDLSGAPAVVKTPTAIDGIAVPTGMTLGEAVAKSPAYEDFLKAWGDNGTIRKGNGGMQVPLQKSGSLYGAKALVTGLSSTSAGAFTQNAVLPTAVDLVGERVLTVRDLCTNIAINTDTFEYVTVTAKTNSAAAVLEATTSATPGLNNVAVGAYTSAHGVKPESTFTVAVVTSPVETIAHFIPVTRRAAADAPQMQGLINAFLEYGLREEEEDQILNGSGTSPNLRGILNVVGINTVGSAGTDIDAIVDGIAAIRADNRNPTAMVIHPNDWYSTGFLLAKDTAGNYIVGDPRASLDQLNQLWGLKVVVTPAMTENTVLIGDFRQAVVADRQQSTIYVTDSHNDWFARNILAVLAEERLGFGVLDPEAFCTVTAV